MCVENSDETLMLACHNLMFLRLGQFENIAVVVRHMYLGQVWLSRVHAPAPSSTVSVIVWSC